MNRERKKKSAAGNKALILWRKYRGDDWTTRALLADNILFILVLILSLAIFYLAASSPEMIFEVLPRIANLSLLAAIFLVSFTLSAIVSTISDENKFLKSFTIFIFLWILSYVLNIAEIVIGKGIVGYILIIALASTEALVVYAIIKCAVESVLWLESFNVRANHYISVIAKIGGRHAGLIAFIAFLYVTSFYLLGSSRATSGEEIGEVFRTLSGLVTSIVFFIANTIIFVNLLALPPISPYKSKLLSIVKRTSIALGILYGTIQIMDYPFLILKYFLGDNVLSIEEFTSYVFWLALAIKPFYATVIIVMAIQISNRMRREDVVHKMGMRGRGVAIIENTQGRIVMLNDAASRFFIGEGNESSADITLSTADLTRLTEAQQINLLSKARKLGSSQILVTASDIKSHIVSISRIENWSNISYMFGEFGSSTREENIRIVITSSVEREDDLRSSLDEDETLPMSLADTFHELAKPIGSISMILTSIANDEHIERAMNSRRGTWENIVFFERLIKDYIYPEIQYLCIIEKMGGISGTHPMWKRVEVEKTVRNIVNDFVNSLIAVKSASHFKELRISPNTMRLLERNAVIGFELPDEPFEFKTIMEVFAIALSELMLNALRHIPDDAIEMVSRYNNILLHGMPILVRVIVDDTKESLEVRIYNICESGIEMDEASFRNEVLARPLGGLASTTTLVRGIGWDLDFKPIRIGGNDTQMCWNFCAVIRNIPIVGEDNE